MKIRMLAGTCAALALANCAPTADPGTPAWTAQQEQLKQEARADQVKQAAAEVPSWYMNPPADDVAIYAPGAATSGDLQLAFDKAVMGAKRALADRVNSRLSSKMKEFLSESGAAEDGKVAIESERVTSNLITEVNLSGYDITQKKLVPSGATYRAYVLVRYPLGGANRILVDQIHKNELLESKVRASKAFQDLEKDIQAARPAEPAAPVAAPPAEVKSAEEKKG